MKTVTVKVLKTHPYGHEMRKPGQIRTIHREHLEILKAIGYVAVEEPPVVKTPVEAPKTPAPPLVQIETAEEADDKPKYRRTYRRRDMQAEAE